MIEIGLFFWKVAVNYLECSLKLGLSFFIPVNLED